MRNIISLTVAFLMTLTLSAQQNRTGSVELTEVEEDGGILTFLVEGISEKKSDVLISGKETLFYKLLYEGVEGVNDGNKLIEHENKYWLTQFFAGKNAPYNAYISKIEQDGPVRKSDNDFTGRYIIILNYRALIRTLKTNGIINHAAAVASVPKKVEQNVGLAAKRANEEAAARAKEEAARKASVEAAKAVNKPAQTADNRIVFSKSGVGPLKMGVNYTLGPNILNKCSLPSSFAGLYDRVDCDRNQFDGSFEIRCMQGENPVLLATCNDDDKVVAFAALSSHCRTAEGLSLGNTAAEILAAGGVDKSWKVVDGQMVFWHYCLYLDGVYFLFREGDGAGGKIKSSAKPVGISNVRHAILDLEFLL